MNNARRGREVGASDGKTGPPPFLTSPCLLLIANCELCSNLGGTPVSKLWRFHLRLQTLGSSQNDTRCCATV
eukprot:4853530-Amphidinium_carterae.1